MGVGLVMMKEESNEGGNECTQLPPCPGVETGRGTSAGSRESSCVACYLDEFEWFDRTASGG